MTAQLGAVPSGPMRLATSVYLRDMLSLLTAFPRTKGLHSSMELAEHCGKCQYSHSNRPALSTTLAPFVETGVFSDLHNIEREATSDQLVAALIIPPLCQHLLPRGGRAESLRTFG
ncbi:hypothetical protein MTO96_021743 [Rhipicephalus appendiculatus]